MASPISPPRLPHPSGCLSNAHPLGIETGFHGRRDGTFHEDRSQLRQGAVPQILSTLNNTVLGLLLRRGVVNVTAARRKLEYHINLGLQHVLADAL
jgi:hypothetical protein